MIVFRISAILLFTLLTAFGSNAEANQKYQPTSSRQGPQMFGIQLRPQIGTLLKNIEKKYGKKIREVIDENLTAITFARATIDPDGTPVIRIKKGIKPTEAMIVHELFHHKYNFPTIEFEPYPEWRTAENATYIQFLLDHLYSSIQHWIFFPAMRSIGLQVDDEIQVVYKQAIGEDNYQVPFGVYASEAQCVFFAKAALNSNDTKLLTQIKAWYKRKGWQDALSKGETLVDIVKRANPKTTEEAIKVFIKCISLIERENAKFQFISNSTKNIGGYYQPWAIIQVNPR